MAVFNRAAYACRAASSTQGIIVPVAHATTQHLSKSCIGEMAVVRTMSVSVFARDRAHCSDDMGVNNTARFTS
jgi:hypothetical protein